MANLLTSERVSSTHDKKPRRERRRRKASEANGCPSLARRVAFDRWTRSTDVVNGSIKLCCKFESPALTFRLDDFLDGLFERLHNVPFGVMGVHFAQVGVTTNVVAIAALIDLAELADIASWVGRLVHVGAQRKVSFVFTV